MAHHSRAQTISLREDIVRASGPLTVDRDRGVIQGVKILGLISSNGRRYSPEAIRKAAGLYEGRAVNIDHHTRPGENTSAYDRFGRIVNVQLRDDGLYGSLEYLKSHVMADRVAEAAERMPGVYGFSHNAYGNGPAGPGRKPAVIESIVNVRSIDLVSDPATTKGLFEMDMAPEMQAAGSPEDQIKSGFRAAIMQVVDDESMDMQAKVSKIKDILKAQDKLMGGGKEGEDASAGDAESPAEESAKAQKPADPTVQQLSEQLAAATRRESVRGLCDQAGLVPTAVQLKALTALQEQADVQALIDQWKPQAADKTAARPRSAAPAHLTESNNGKGKVPEERKEFLKALRR